MINFKLKYKYDGRIDAMLLNVKQLQGYQIKHELKFYKAYFKHIRS